MSSARAGHTSTVLTTGHVLNAGGSDAINWTAPSSTLRNKRESPLHSVWDGPFSWPLLSPLSATREGTRLAIIEAIFVFRRLCG